MSQLNETDFDLMKSRLQQHPLYSQIEDALLNFIVNEQAAQRCFTPTSKEMLKVILSGLVERVWEAAQPPKTSKSKSQISLSYDFTHKPSAKPRHHRTSTNSFLALNRPVNTPRVDSSFEALNRSLMSRNPHEALSHSNFCRIKGAGSFGRASRKLNEMTQISPGPTDYKVNALELLARSPRAVIPKARPKAEAITPGPSAYYPINLSLSKRLRS
jgi:hypothetical protein